MQCLVVTEASIKRVYWKPPWPHCFAKISLNSSISCPILVKFVFNFCNTTFSACKKYFCFGRGRDWKKSLWCVVLFYYEQPGQRGFQKILFDLDALVTTLEEKMKGKRSAIEQKACMSRVAAAGQLKRRFANGIPRCWRLVSHFVKRCSSGKGRLWTDRCTTNREKCCT